MQSTTQHPTQRRPRRSRGGRAASASLPSQDPQPPVTSSEPGAPSSPTTRGSRVSDQQDIQHRQQRSHHGDMNSSKGKGARRGRVRSGQTKDAEWHKVEVDLSTTGGLEGFFQLEELETDDPHFVSHYAGYNPKEEDDDENEFAGIDDDDDGGGANDGNIDTEDGGKTRKRQKLKKKQQANEKNKKRGKKRKHAETQTEQSGAASTAESQGKKAAKTEPVATQQEPRQQPVQEIEESEMKETQEGEPVADDQEESEHTDATEQVPVEDLDMSAWQDLKLSPLLIKGLQSLRFQSPTPVQSQCIAAALKGRKDIFAAAETGSGKTLAYSLPILHKLLQERGGAIKQAKQHANRQPGFEALILTPTRELAIQVMDHIKAVCKDTGLWAASLIGGMSQDKQHRLLHKRPNIVVATPGRLWDILHQTDSGYNETQLSEIRFIVIDEADRMIEGGHFPEIKSIFQILNQSFHDDTDDLEPQDDVSGPTTKGKQPDSNVQVDRQTFIFSATLTVPVAARTYASRQPTKKKPKSTLDHLKGLIGGGRQRMIVDLTTDQLVASSLKETHLRCLENEKDYYLYYFYLRYGGRTLVFVNSVAAIRRLKPICDLLGMKAWSLYASMQQRQRLKNLERFKSTSNALLIATDVAARGLDIPLIDHVLHYQLPRTSELYVHRSGRTARASASGTTLLFVDPKDNQAYHNICQVVHHGGEVPTFDVDPSYMKQISQRVNLARKVDAQGHALRKKTSEREWIKNTAKQMEIEPDEELLSEEDEETVWKEKKESREVSALNQQLKALLREPLVPKGTSSKYFTKTSVLPSLLAAEEKKPTVRGRRRR
eukprot:TRINITY_DN1529_c1_g1_i2.p1 TRINITY_DN1529_c1_g1~~TRINITY_DN1529_c1_g1_i2.p1  ORF type:complete len:830 (+),score=144.70 TRINITY_DN1529_c1_g1_i2:1691-4180(+)